MNLGWEKVWAWAPSEFRAGGKPSHLAANLAKLLSPRQHVVDIGCGMGRNAKYLANLGFKVSAIDVSPSALRVVRTEILESCLSVALVQGSFASLPFRPGCFDGALAVNVIYHATKIQIQSVIAQVSCLVRPGGWFVF